MNRHLLAVAFGFRQSPCGSLPGRNHRLRHFSRYRRSGPGGNFRELAFIESDTRGVHAHHVCSDLPRLFNQLLDGHINRCAADRRGTAAERADAVLHNRRVAVNHRDVVDVDAELIGDDLRE